MPSSPYIFGAVLLTAAAVFHAPTQEQSTSAVQGTSHHQFAERTVHTARAQILTTSEVEISRPAQTQRWVF